MDRRSLFAGAAALGALALPAAAAAQGAAGGKAHTFVLQHGAWHGGWCWERVARRLRAAGHRVLTPTSTGLGERAHLLSRQVTVEVFVEDLTSVLESEELEQVILVGHSFGGIAISGAAERATARIQHLVYLDAVLLQPGKSVLGSLTPEVAAQRRATIKAGGGMALPPPATGFFGIAENGPDAEWLRRRLTPHPAMTYDSELNITRPLGAGLPTTYIACTVNPLMSIEPMRQWAKARQGWTYEELDTVHNAMMSAPDQLTERLLRIAAA